MKGYIGITSYDWWDYLKDKRVDYLDFWCSKKQFKVLDKGDYFFFLRKNKSLSVKKERELVGYARFNHFEYITPDEAWDSMVLETDGIL